MCAKRSIEVSVEEGPSVVVSNFFKGVSVPSETEFQLYKKRKHDEYVLHGENSRLEYDGESDPLAGSASQYVVGVYDKESDKIQLYKAPVVTSKIIPKSTKALKGPEIKSKGDVRFAAMRNALGEAFGTKKAKKAIADLERNRIDSDKLTDVAVDIVDTVKTASRDLPTRAELQENVSASNRPTPVANVDATDVEQIYPVDSIIPKKELQFIRVGPILKEQDKEAKLELFPYTGSKYVAKKLDIFTQASQMEKLQLLYYLSLLLGVYENRRVSNKQKLLERLNTPPEILVDGILERFTVLRGGQFGKSKNRSYFIDPQNEDKLLCFILAIVLHLDNFLVEISPLAQELGLKPSRIVNLFRILGAVVKGATVAQAEAFGIPKSAAATYKIASLKVPFKLPEMTRRGRAARR